MLKKYITQVMVSLVLVATIISYPVGFVTQPENSLLLPITTNTDCPFGGAIGGGC